MDKKPEGRNERVEGNIILSDEDLEYHIEITQEGISAIHRDYCINIRPKRKQEEVEIN